MPENSTISPLSMGEGPEGRAGSGRNTPNPYLQVALTYVRRPFSSPQSWAVSMIFLFIGAGLFGMVFGGDRRDVVDSAAGPALITVPAVLAMAFFAMFVHHVKGQFADSRAHLVPGFRRVHAAVAAAAALLLTVILPMVLIWLADLRSVGLVALTVFLFGDILYQSTHQNLSSWLLSALTCLGLFAAFTEPARLLIWQLVSGKFEVEAVALIALGAVLVLIGGVRLVRLNEDMPAYQQIACVGAAGRCTTAQWQARAWPLVPGSGERFIEWSMARRTSHARRAVASWWSAVHRWQVGMPPWSSALVTVYFAFVLFLLGLAGGHEPRNAGAVFAMGILSFMPSCMAWGPVVHWRASTLAGGMLLPVDRRTLVRQVGAAAAIDQLGFWASMGACMALCAWFADPKAFSVADFAVLLGVFTLLQFWFFGVGAWFARYRSFGMWVGGNVLGCYVLIAAGAICAATGPLIPWRYMGFSLGGILALSGLLLTYDAYRRWLVADFD